MVVHLGVPELLTLGDPGFPAELCALAEPPARLHVLGEVLDWSKCVAVVGTRRASAQACHFARRLARELVEAGCAVVSGGATGIDVASHLGALEAGGQTAVVLGTPLARPYPSRNIPVFKQVLARGCILSEITDESEQMYPARFLGRNRLIAALSQVVVVVQAPLRSGALSTAAHARKLGRTLLAVPDAPWNLRGEGTLKLLAEGAGICRNSADVLSIAALGCRARAPERPRRRAKEQKNQRFDEEGQVIVSALAERPLAVDQLCEVTGLSASQVQRVLLMLMLSKDVYEDGCGRYVRSDFP